MDARRETALGDMVVRPVIINDPLQPNNVHNNNNEISAYTITQPVVREHNGNVKNRIRSDILYDDRKFAVKKLYNAITPITSLFTDSVYAIIAKKQEEYLYVSTPSKLDYFKQLFILERIFKGNDNNQSNQQSNQQSDQKVPCRICKVVHLPTNLAQRIASQGNIHHNPFYERLNSGLRPDFSVLNRTQSSRPVESNNEDMFKTPERATRKRKNYQEDNEDQEDNRKKNERDEVTINSSQASKKRGRPPRK